jgi:hypothetical protein
LPSAASLRPEAPFYAELLVKSILVNISAGKLAGDCIIYYFQEAFLWSASSLRLFRAPMVTASGIPPGQQSRRSRLRVKAPGESCKRREDRNAVGFRCCAICGTMMNEHLSL